MVCLMDDDQYKFPIGCRVKVNENYATVKYVGAVQGYNGVWLGIEWDNPNRGKHDGNINGIYYFKTEYPTSGSMIRLNKIEKFETLEESIRKKYINFEENQLDGELLKEAQKQLHANVFEIVGMEKIAQKQSKMEELCEISVMYSPINSAGDLNDLENLKILNLSSTLIWNWNIVADITKQLPTLTDINLSYNRLQLPNSEDIDELEPYFRYIKHIVLGKCGITEWDDINSMALLWPNIESLGLQENCLKQITNIDCNKIFKNLKRLDLHKTNISDFNEIIKLGCIETLEILLLMENNIKYIQFPPCDYDKKLQIFPNLREINLFHNPINDEPSVFNELDKLESLTSLCKTSDEKSGFEEMFSMAVGLISNLKYLNRIYIENESRRGAEYDIWKKYAKEWHSTENSEKNRLEFCQKFRNYNNLIKKHGSPIDFMIQQPKKVSNLLKLKIQHKETGEIWEKKVIRKLSLQTLQSLIMKQFRLKNAPKLSYVAAEQKNLKVELDSMSKTLDFYSVQDEDIIIVE